LVADHPVLQLSDVKKELDELEQRLNKRIDAAADRILHALMDQADSMHRQIREQMGCLSLRDT
jgi:small-conductance mechanosensitive channel